jgi:uncharacterized protein (TIGR00730 family)
MSGAASLESLAIAVFCGSSPGGSPIYGQAARRLGRLIAEGGHSLVFGGGNVGLMGEVARAARGGGAKVVGILPEFLRRPEIAFDEGAELIIVPDLQSRKALMMERADAFVILPGGLGTLDEYFEVLTTVQLRIFGKPIVVVDVADYFAPLRALHAHMIEQGFTQPADAALHHFVADADAALALLSRLPARPDRS